MKPGDLVTTCFNYNHTELWSEKRGFINCGVLKGDMLLVLREESKRVKVLTPRGLTGWIVKYLLRELP